MKIINPAKKRWYALSDKIRFIIIGCINAAIMYAIYALFVLILSPRYYQMACAFAWIFSSISSFFMHKIWVFHVKGDNLKRYLKCCSTWFVSYLINAILLEFFVKFCHINIYISQILAPSIAGILTYLAFKKYALSK